MTRLRDDDTDFSALNTEKLGEAKAALWGLPWYIIYGVPVVLVLVIVGSVLGWIGGIFESNTRTLDAVQMQIVQDSARQVAEGYVETVDGKTEKGQLLLCSNSDSDPKGSVGYMKVTCTVRIPVVKTTTDAAGKQVQTLTKMERNMDCGIPLANKASGCKLKQ